jgi:type I restriction enzyme S subunit
MLTLGEVAEISGGGTPSRSESRYFGGELCWATPTDVTALDELYIGRTRETLTQEGLKNSSAKLLPAGAVLLTSRATIGYTAVSKVPICTNQGFVNFVCGPALEPEYLAYWLRARKPMLERLANGATFKEISRGTVRKLAIELPSRDVQRRIIDLLARAESIARMRREAEAKAKEIIPALFLDMFGDPATNPKRWEVHLLGHVAEVVSGVAKGRKLNGKTTRLVPYLRVANVQAGHLDLTELKSLEATRDEISELALRTGDVLLTEGGDHDKLGRGALLDRDLAECIHQNHVFRVRANLAAIVPEYFVSFLQTDLARGYFLRSAKKTTNLASINMTQLKSLPVLVPPVSEQRVFERRFSSCRLLQGDQRRAVALAEEGFRSLIAGVVGNEA